MDILKKRWQEVDKKLTTFYNKNKILNKEMLNNIQQIFESIDTDYEGLFNYISDKYKRILRTKVNEIKDKLEGYSAYILNEYINKRKLRYSEYLTGLFIIEYYKRDLKRQELEQKLFEEVANIVYIETQQEVIDLEPKKKHKLKNIIPEVFLMQLIAMSKYNDAFWKEYKQGNISYNAEQLFKQVAVNMQIERPLEVDNDDFKKLFEKQEKNYLVKKNNIEEKDRYIDMYYGPLDNIMVGIANQVALKGMIDQGCKKVQFIATIDDRTTDMCRSLNNQVFKIKGINKYYRYSAIDDKEIEYTTDGLVIGENLPPISNHIHHCRSTIYPVRDAN